MKNPDRLRTEIEEMDEEVARTVLMGLEGNVRSSDVPAGETDEVNDRLRELGGHSVRRTGGARR